MKTTLLIAIIKAFAFDTSTGYVIGAIIALFILAYLIYSLIKPEKF